MSCIWTVSGANADGQIWQDSLRPPLRYRLAEPRWFGRLVATVAEWQLKGDLNSLQSLRWAQTPTRDLRDQPAG
jgi:hypothetical protein